jgi:hypothetical protein
MKTDQVKMFCGIRTIGEHRYIVHIPATSWTEAVELGGRIGAVIDGELIEEQATGLCSICKGNIVTANYENPQPVKEETWDDVIGEEE